MTQSSLLIDEDQDSLFGSPPPSPARGRPPSQETFIAGEEIGPIIAIPSTGVGRKNVGTIALPGSHMSCAELPANLPASSLSLPRPASSRDSPLSIAGTLSVHTPVAASRSSTRSVPSRAPSAASNILSTSAFTRKRRTPKAKSATPAPPVPPITLPGPNEPTPPNLLRSQSSLLGLAGLVGCVKPAQLYTHGPQPAAVQQSHSHSPICGSTPAHPIVLDDDDNTPYIGKHPRSQLQMPQCLDQLDPEVLRSNITNSLTREKNILPVLESLIKLFGGEPHLPSANPPPKAFVRSCSRGVFDAQPPLCTPSGSTPAVPPPKRRKLKHVPAGAIDWDVPFPFAVGEGPEAYRDTWARDRVKQLLAQLLELVQGATKRAAIKTAKSRGKASEGQPRAQQSQSSRSASVETQIGQIDSTQAIAYEPSLYTGSESAVAGIPMDSLNHFVSSLEIPNVPAPCLRDRTPMELECAVETGSPAVSCDYSTFEEWLSQLQQFVPLGANTQSDWATRPSVPLDSSASSPRPNTPVSLQHDTLTASHATSDEVIDPALLAISQQGGSAPRSESPTSVTSALAPGDIVQILDASSMPPALTHSPRTSLSSLIEPLTPHSEAFADVLTSQDPIRDPPEPAQKDHHSQPPDREQPLLLFPCSTEPSKPLRATTAQKGKGRVDVSVVASPAPSASGRSTPSAKGALNKRAILERAHERRRQLVAEIERAKTEIWEMSIENAVLVHFMRNGSL